MDINEKIRELYGVSKKDMDRAHKKPYKLHTNKDQAFTVITGMDGDAYEVILSNDDCVTILTDKDEYIVLEDADLLRLSDLIDEARIFHKNVDRKS